MSKVKEKKDVDYAEQAVDMYPEFWTHEKLN